MSVSPNIRNTFIRSVQDILLGKKVSNTEAATYLELLLESAAALLVAVQLLFGGRGLVSDLLTLLMNVRHSRLVVSRGYLIKKSHIGANF